MADDVTAQQSAQPLIGKDEDGSWKLIGSKLAGIKAYIVGPFVDEANGVAVVEQGQFDYQLVAASQSATTLGTGAVGDLLHRVLIIPATTGAGDVSIKDGSDSAIPIFETGTLADLKPISVELNIRSTDGAWQIVTGANVSVIAIGRFTP